MLVLLNEQSLDTFVRTYFVRLKAQEVAVNKVFALVEACRRNPVQLQRIRISLAAAARAAGCLGDVLLFAQEALQKLAPVVEDLPTDTTSSTLVPFMNCTNKMTLPWGMLQRWTTRQCNNDVARAFFGSRDRQKVILSTFHRCLYPSKTWVLAHHFSDPTYCLRTPYFNSSET